MDGKCVSSVSIEDAKRNICGHRGVVFTPACDLVMSGCALKTESRLPINGLRHPPTTDTTGWYIWYGESYSDEEDFFQPVCTLHLYEKHPATAHLLGLPPGDRFLAAEDYLEVWFDPSLLNISET